MRLIDADALIDRIKNPYEQAQVARWVNEQPTIEPEKRTEERTETHACDLISRQAAIDAVNSHFGFSVEEEYGSAVQEVLNDLPSVQPEIIRCEDCKYWDTTWQNDWAKSYHYCPLIDGIRNGDWYCADAER